MQAQYPVLPDDAAASAGAAETPSPRAETATMGFDDILAMRQRRLDMEAQRDILDQKIAQGKADAVLARDATLLRILDAMDECGITSRDILDRRPLPIAFPPLKRRAKVARYFDPESGRTWDGTGLKPHWYQQHLKNGGTVEDLMVQAVLLFEESGAIVPVG